MLRKITRNKGVLLGVLACVLALVLVRFFERDLFYDPLLLYFKSDYLEQGLPDFVLWKLLCHFLFRYGLNTVFSLGIIYFLFKDKSMLSFAGVLYVFLFLVLITAFCIVVCFYPEDNALLLFYIRRFLIQPLFILLFVPAFYYNSKMK